MKILSLILVLLISFTASCYRNKLYTNAEDTTSTLLQLLDSQGINTSGGVTPFLYKTGQTACYDAAGAPIACTASGQDGEFQYGRVWPVPRFTDNGDGSITDNLTGLMWITNMNIMPTRDPGFDSEGTINDGGVYWQTALNYVALLNAGNHLGYNDWRLPNTFELLSLNNHGTNDAITWLTAFGFSNVSASYYWSSTTYTNREYAWSSGFVGITKRKIISDKDGAFRFVTAVRLSSSVVPKTSQTLCYDATATAIACAGTGQDGELQEGAAWPVPRFTDNGDGTLTDELTGLMWISDLNIMTTQNPAFDAEDVAGDGAVTWQTALNYINNLNTISYLGYNDWRLPNINELYSLLSSNTGGTNGAWLNTNGFTNTGTQNHWASTTYENTASSAFVLNIIYESSTQSNKSTLFRYVVPVRAGLGF